MPQEFLEGPGLSRDLDSLLALSGPQPDAAAAAASRALSKVVLARRVAVRLRGTLDALALLSLLQRADPSSYQVALVLPSGAAFVSSTPERLFMRHGRTVTAEAIAGTLPTACMARMHCALHPRRPVWVTTRGSVQGRGGVAALETCKRTFTSGWS